MNLLQTIFGGVGAGLSWVANSNQAGSPSPMGGGASSSGIPVSHKLDMGSMMPIILAVLALVFIMKRK